jgi:hypothetical protein
MPERYKSNEKVAARLAIWSHLGKSASRPVLHMPGRLRDEFDVILSKGFSPKQVWAVDRQRGVLAHFTMHLTAKEKNDCHRISGYASEAAKKIHAGGVQLGAAHLDFIGHAGSWRKGHPLPEIEAFMRTGILLNGRLAVTVQAQRDPGQTSNKNRVGLIRLAIERGLRFTSCTVAEIESQSYLNGLNNQVPMLWVVYKISKGKQP